MKYLLPVLLSTTMIFSTCAQNSASSESAPDQNATANPTKTETADVVENECKICDFDFASYKGELNKEEVEALLLALNDEYLAWATYDKINKDFDSPRPFINIQKAEARHIDRLKTLFDTHKISIPENKWKGETAGFESVAEACKAGVDAEIANAALYDKLLKSTKREDILFVYKNLQRASEENHLPAFKRCGQGRGKGNGPGSGRGNGRGRGRN